MQELPVAVVGAGPVGLAAAAHLVERGLTPLIFEQGASVGAAVAAWSHVRVFTPWSLNLDAAATRLLATTGWTAPDADAIPTGGEIVAGYLAPLAAHPAIAPRLRLGARVTAITREGFDKMTSPGRDAAPFLLRWRDRDGVAQTTRARAVIDASGTWGTPNPLGVDGLPVEGEADHADRIDYGIPDVAGARRGDFAGRRILVVGSGHSAINVVLGLLELKQAVPETAVIWGLRRGGVDRLAGGGLADRLVERGALGLAAGQAVAGGRLQLLAPFAVAAIGRDGDRLAVRAREGGEERRLVVDRIVVATGFRPDLGLTREIRLALDAVVEAPPALAPLIDPNLHSCGSVPPHGAVELAHPEKDFYVVGMKSYGRAPTFLLATGYEQVRSVAAALAGDMKAAREVRLALPETGVCAAAPPVSGAAACCGTPARPVTVATVPAEAAGSACCGGPAPADVEGCCAADAAALAAGTGGCGCTPASGPAPARAGAEVVPA